MIRHALRRISFDHLGIAFTVSVIASLYYAAATDLWRNHAGAVAPEPAAHDAAPGPAPAPARVAIAALPPLDDGAGPGGAAEVFLRIGYRLDAVREHGEVPRVFMASLPHELSSLTRSEQRKVMFIKTALPLILHVNELIALDRARIVALRDQAAGGVAPSREDAAWLAFKAAEYGLDKVNFPELVRRVDTVPPSLALAQSAEESGWGTSRFAREGNALFGQRTWGEGDGIVPIRRDVRESFRVAAFNHLIDGVKSYARNLNSHPAYDEFRRLRAAQRRDFDSIDGHLLAGALLRYSERGPHYVRSIRAIIRANALDVFDRARLGDRVATDSLGAPDA